MSDNLLLTSLWLVPLIGLVIVLIVPKQTEQAVKWVALGFTLADVRRHAGRAGDLRERRDCQDKSLARAGRRTTRW